MGAQRSRAIRLKNKQWPVAANILEDLRTYKANFKVLSNGISRKDSELVYVNSGEG